MPRITSWAIRSSGVCARRPQSSAYKRYCAISVVRVTGRKARRLPAAAWRTRVCGTISSGAPPSPMLT